MLCCWAGYDGSSADSLSTRPSDKVGSDSPPPTPSFFRFLHADDPILNSNSKSSSVFKEQKRVAGERCAAQLQFLC